MSNLIEKLNKEIAEQTRNGREDVYIEVDDLNELGYRLDPNKKGRVFVDVGYLKIAMERYEFKDRIKVKTDNKTYRQVLKEIRDLEKERE